MSDMAFESGNAPIDGGGVRAASPAPYQQAMQNLGIDGGGGEPLTPIQQALAASQPSQQPPGWQPPEPAPAQQPAQEPSFQNPYRFEEPADQEPSGDPMEQVNQRLELLQQMIDQQAVARAYQPEPQYQTPAPPNLQFDPNTGQWMPVQANQGPTLPTLDPYDEQSVARFNEALPQYLQSRDEHVARTVAEAVVQQFAPVTEVFESMAEERGREAALGYFQELESSGFPRFDHDLAYQVAHSMSQQGVDPAEALVEAARWSNQFMADKYDEWAKINHETVQNVVGAPAAVPAAPAAASEIAPVRPGRSGYEDVAGRYNGLRVVSAG